MEIVIAVAVVLAMLACLLDEVKAAHVDLLSGTECTGLQPAPGGLVVETSSGPGMCTYLIAADGRIWRLVEETCRAWHAGQGAWGEIGDVNSHSLGIELANSGNQLI